MLIKEADRKLKIYLFPVFAYLEFPLANEMFVFIIVNELSPENHKINIVFKFTFELNCAKKKYKTKNKIF